jgi:serine protease Do
MSLFDDDFYSTKPTKQRQWKQRDASGTPSLRRNLRLNRTLTIGIGGVIVVLLLLCAVWLSKDSQGKAVQAAASASTAFPSLSSDPFVDVADKIKPAVVSVMTSKKDDKESGVGVGSGVVYQKSGNKALVVTNNHVVENGTQYEVVTYDGEHRKATLVGQDLVTDLAVLEIDASGIKAVAEFGDSDRLKAGEFAIAVGNPLGLGYSPTVTLGIISLPKRTIPVALSHEGDNDWEMDVIQTDAAINQGNSGGPLVNMEGKVIGINSMKIANTGVEGLGFAIPINAVKPVIESLVTNHKVKRPLLGVSSQDLQSFTGTDALKLPTDVKTGVIVFDVSGPAKEAGLQAQDVIVQLDSRQIATTIALRKYLYNEKKIGDKITITFYRGTKKMTATMLLAEAGVK